MADGPLRATHHCRHYNYEHGLHGRGPICARGIDLSAPAANRPCMPEATDGCVSREEYTDAERAVWVDYRNRRLTMLSEAVEAIPAAVPIGSEGRTTCPHCAGFLSWSRMRNGNVWLQCSGPGCIGPVHFNIPRDQVWPTWKARP